VRGLRFLKFRLLDRVSVTIVGSGLMGRGIGLAFAMGGHQVTMVDLNTEILNRSLEQTRSTLRTIHDAGLASEPFDEILSRISLEPELEKAASNSDFVVEAIFENPDVKKETFRKLDGASKTDTILASNTSSIPISSIASDTSHPERVVGAHFWNPPHLMSAVEVVYGEKTNDETVTKTVEILRGIGKKPAIVRKDVPGQIGIRILYAMIREATHLVESGIASPEDIDTVVKEALGTRLEVVGPLELADLSGVDLVNNVAKGLYKTLDSSAFPQKIVQDMVARGELGIKSGKGFYDWRSGSRNADETIKRRDEHLIKILRERRRREEEDNYDDQ
jgi:3-hydroxybutyryl-CoA dehydrogenase